MSRTKSIVSRFPDFYRSQDVENTFYRFIDVFGQMLSLAEEDLITVMKSHWIDKANNEDSKGFGASQKGDMDKIFALYLQSLGGTSLLRQINRRSGVEGIEDDRIYRERIKGLIDVLREGASTKDGIRSIVAANLGIVDDDELAQKLRNQIRIIEYMPQIAGTGDYNLSVLEQFMVTNPNVVNSIPNIRIRVRDDFYAKLLQPRVTNLTNQESAVFNGELISKDTLDFFSDGSVFKNGEQVDQLSSMANLPPGDSQWRFDAEILFDESRFNLTRFDFSLYGKDAGSLSVLDRFYRRNRIVNQLFNEKAVELQVTQLNLRPGTFQVVIPWNFDADADATEEEKARVKKINDQLDNNDDQPRTHIRFIVNKVKAAGVFADVAYQKNFKEDHDVTTSLQLIGEHKPFIDDADMKEADLKIGSLQVPYPDGIDQELADSFTTSGVMDFSGFDSLNTFG